MVALPARPSPMDAPMAPPPRAMPNAIMAAAKWSIYPSSVSMLGLESFTREAEVGDRQQHEYESLDEPDEADVEELPHRQDDRPGEPRSDVRQVTEQQHDDISHQQAGKEVAEKSHREGDRLDDLVDDVQRDEQEPPGHRHVVRSVPEEVAEVALWSVDAERVPLDDQENHRAHRQGLIEVGVGGMHVRDQRDG